MTRKLFVFLTLFVVSVLAYLTTLWLPEPSTTKLFQSAITITVLYAVFSIGIEEVFAHRLKDSKTRYGFRKAISLILIILILIVLLRIWVPNPQALLVAYGVVAAGLAVALQDLVKNLAGSLTIFLGGSFKGLMLTKRLVGLFRCLTAQCSISRCATIPNNTSIYGMNYSLW